MSDSAVAELSFVGLQRGDDLFPIQTPIHLFVCHKRDGQGESSRSRTGRRDGKGRRRLFLFVCTLDREWCWQDLTTDVLWHVGGHEILALSHFPC